MPFVLTGGQVANLDRPAGRFGSSVRVTEQIAQTYAEIWRTQPQVRTVVGFLARNIAQIGLHCFERTSDTDRTRLNDGPIASLLRRPYPRVSPYRFKDALIHDMGIYDNSIHLKVKGDKGGPPTGLLRLPPDKVSPVGESWIAPEGYRFKGSKGYRDFDPSEVVHIRGYNPADNRWGVSPMETLRRILAEEYEAGNWREQLWRNGARFPGHIRRPKDAPPWSAEGERRFRENWKGLYTGSGPAVGGTPILEDGMTFEAGGITPEQAQYLEARKLTRSEVAAAFYIPAPMVGILDNATFSNIAEQHKQLYQDTLGPWLTQIQEEFAVQLIDELDSTGKVYVEFNLAEKMRGSFEEQAASLQTSVGGPWLTRNEARARQNLSAIDGGDELIVPLNVVTGGQASPTDSAPKADGPVTHKAAGPAGVKARASSEHDDKATKVLAKFFRRQSSVVLSALGAKAAADWWDTDRWDKELATDLFKLGVDVSSSVAAGVLADLDIDPDVYDTGQTEKFLKAVAASRAGMINAATKDELDAAVDSEDDEGTPTPADVFTSAETDRAPVAATTFVTTMSAFGTTEAAKQAAGDSATKTWVVTSGNPRPEHAAMDGETVGIDETFSNGANWPGDPALGADGVAGCTCDVSVSTS